MQTTFLTSIIISVLLGLLIGAERERRQRKQGFSDFAGIRTFTLISLFGFLSCYFNQDIPFFFIASFSLFCLFIICTYLYNAFQKNFSGITTELSAILTFIVGALCLRHAEVAVPLGICLPLLLVIKEMSHNFLARVSDSEFFSTIQFAIIAFVILPFLPDHTIDPWNALNPFALWQIVVFLSGVSFLGYILIRILGMNLGTRLTAFFGGIASSTAVTASFGVHSREVGKDHAVTNSLVSALMIAIASSFIRIVFVAWLTNPTVAWAAILPISIIGTVLIVTGFLFSVFFSQQKIRTKLKLESPFQLKHALQFALYLSIILVLSNLSIQYFGTYGLYLTSMLSGMAKGDAIAVVVATMVTKGTLTVSVAVKAILLSIGTSFISKTVLCRISGTKIYALRFAIGALIGLVTTGILFLFV